VGARPGDAFSKDGKEIKIKINIGYMGTVQTTVLSL
jgi:hypothetical protein